MEIGLNTEVKEDESDFEKRIFLIKEIMNFRANSRPIPEESCGKLFDLLYDKSEEVLKQTLKNLTKIKNE